MDWSKDQDFRRMMIVDRYEHPHYLISEIQAVKLPKGYFKIIAKSNSCVDNYELYVKLDNQMIEDVKFSGVGCVIATASTDFLIEALLNKKIPEAIILLEQYIALETENIQPKSKHYPKNLLLFDQIHRQPNRIKCATLVASTLYANFKEQ